MNIRERISRIAHQARQRRSSVQGALDAIFLPLAIGQALSALETLTLKGAHGPDRLLRGLSASRAPEGTLRQRALEALDLPVAPKVLAGVSLCGALSTVLPCRGRRKFQIIGSAMIVLCNSLNELRTPYGRDGADQMTSVITQYRVLTGLIPGTHFSDELFLQAVNAQAALSYFTSGISKLFGPSWVRGTAVSEIMSTDVYGSGVGSNLLKSHPRAMKMLSYATVAWESLFPLVYLLPKSLGNVAVAGVKAFHLGIAAMMELPRFFWGFSGSHGAVLHMINRDQGLDFAHQRLVPNACGAAVAITSVSAIHAASERNTEMQRRRSAEGTLVVDLGTGQVEHFLQAPPAFDQSEAVRNWPIVVLEPGLGAPIESWDWVMKKLSDRCFIVSHHRAGYGLSTTLASHTETVTHLLRTVPSHGPIILVGHSFGALMNGALIKDAPEDIRRRITGVVLVDGTDSELLEMDRRNPDRRGTFLQAQLNSMFLALSGIYNFAPNAVSRQSQYSADVAFSVLQFSFTPRHIVTAVKEYDAAPTQGIVEAMREVPIKHVVSSEENEVQQAKLAGKVDAKFSLIPGAAHRSIIGHRSHASAVAGVICDVLQKVGDNADS